VGAIAKPLKRVIRRYTRAGRAALAHRSPAWVRRFLGPLASYFDLMVMDHGLVRAIYLNQHRLGTQAWRSAQPAPHDIARFKRLGIKTVVNLRGESATGGHWLEVAACERHGINLEICKLRSRAAPTVAELLRARDVLQRIEYPIAVHCKSGADRAGLMSVLYMHLIEKQPIEQAVAQLSWKFGHIKQADTGVLDHFFEHYMAANRDKPIGFYDWVENVYEPKVVLETFHANGFLSRILKYILRRE